MPLCAPEILEYRTKLFILQITASNIIEFLLLFKCYGRNVPCIISFSHCTTTKGIRYFHNFTEREMTNTKLQNEEAVGPFRVRLGAEGRETAH